MKDQTQPPGFNVRHRLIGDMLLLTASILPSTCAFLTDFNHISSNLFPRTGAIMALFAAFLEFRTHEIQMMRSRDAILALWRAIGTLMEGMAKVDAAAKYSARQLATLIKSVGIKPDIGDPDDIKDMVVTEKIKALKFLPLVPEAFYRYSSIVSIIGKVLVVFGTLIWAFGDLVVNLLN